ncbi:DUF5682 family protein [Corynebacterium sp.]|uniref:DUF5682 family protein n=1 Tax=Corynebacterium sp. TaxID=1720 RepID=UPI0026DC9EA1|nr:DUF5682 family protein [Corynebacterium sp.]MDO5077342.1 DUF5682 family protein [Corynebacterium sp.]
MCTDPNTLLDALTAAPQTLFGVRHHSPACARAVIAAAEELQPTAIAVEFPADLADSLEWLGHPETVAPIAVAVSDSELGPVGLSLYPFADFSPELAIIRWARQRSVPVHCIDLPVGARHEFTEQHARSRDLVDVSDLVGQEAWDTKVESRAVGEPWRNVRRAALAVGVGARLSDGALDSYTAAREAYMRARLSKLEESTLVVVGSYHCLGLLDGDAVEPATTRPIVSSIVRYSFQQLDSRSGYASGIRDPQWQQGIWGCASPQQVTEVAREMITDIARECRAGGEPAGTGEVAEACRFAGDLARIRGLGGPGRREVVEALTSVFSHGDVLGRGRGIAEAMRAVLVGDRYGELPEGAPVPALEAHTRAELAKLGLPSQERKPSVSKRVDPFQGGKDFARHLLLTRMDVLGINYVREKTNSSNRGLEARSYTATCVFSSTTAAGLVAVSHTGVTLEQAVHTVLGARLAADEVEPSAVLEVIQHATRAGAGEVLLAAVAVMESQVLHRLGFADAVQAIEVLMGVVGNREPAARLFNEHVLEKCGELATQLGAVVVREIHGISGSEDTEHARLLGQVAGLIETHQVSVVAALRNVKRHGSPLMQGAAYAVLDALDGSDADYEQTAAFIGSWIDQGVAAATRRKLQLRLTGYLCASRGVWCDSPSMNTIIDRVNAVEDELFVQALPALRGAFDTVAAAERERFLDFLRDRVGYVATEFSLDPRLLEANARMDVAARERLTALGLADVSFTPAMRWRLILGAEPEALDERACRMASALDELYGGPGDDPTGEADGRVRGAGRGPSQLSVRKWAQEIEVLFGEDHIQEIFGAAAEQGRGEVVTTLDVEEVRPSVELLTTVLNLQGALPESRLRRLRPLVAKIVEELSRELAQQLTPVMAGYAQARPTRRRSSRFDMPLTIRRNLKHVVELNGRPQIVPVTPMFRAPEQRVSPWHIIVLVDVSGSMEASTVYAAMTAAILAGVRTMKVSFITFDTGVIDLSDHASDPLELLLEIRVGGGTNIAQAVRYAATKVENPNKTALILVSDFEEFGSLGRLTGAIRHLAASGVKLIGCAALDDAGQAVYNVGVAEQVAAAGMRVASVTPMQLARWVGEVLK